MATNADEFLAYNNGLKKKIQKLFIERIVPANFVMVITKYSSYVLTDLDIARIRKNLDHKIDQDVNMDMLDLMARYDGWFECLIKCLGDSELKQTYLIQAFQKLKSEFDEEYNRGKSNPQTTERKILDVPNGNEIESDFVLQLHSNGVSEGNLATDGRQGNAMNSVANIINTHENPPLTNNDKLWYFENGKGTCNACKVELTSEQLKDQHLAGQRHIKTARQWSDKKLTTAPKCLEGIQSDFVLPVRGEQDMKSAAVDNAVGVSAAVDDVLGGSVAVGDAAGVSAAVGDAVGGGAAVADAVGGSAAVGSSATVDEPNQLSDDVNTIVSTLEDLSLDNDGQWSFENGKGRCHVCEIDLTSEQHKTQHLAGQKHLKKAGQLSQKLALQPEMDRNPTGNGAPSCEVRPQSVGLENQSFCETCKLALTSTEHASQHYSGRNHKKKVDQDKREKTDQQNGAVGGQENGNTPGDSRSFKSPYYLEINGLGRCNVCKVAFTSQTNADDHLKGKMHAKNMKTWDPR